jgi:hypothetical protein
MYYVGDQKGSKLNGSRNSPNSIYHKIIIIMMMMMIIIIIPNNKPDIVIRDNEKGTCMLIDVTIPGDRNMIQKEAEKIFKYKDLTIEIQRTWNVKN